MATVSLANAIRDFEAALDDLETTSRFVGSATRLRPRLGGILDRNTMDGDAKTLVENFLRDTAEESILYRGLVVSVFGAFEELVRRTLRDGIEALNARGSAYDSLADVLKRGNLFWTGRALQTVYEPVDHLQFEFETLSKNVGTCFPGSPQPVLNADAFAMFISTFNPRNLAEALGRIGVGLHWDDFGRAPALQKVLGKKNTRDTATAVQESLKRYGQIRNKIAHTGSTGVVVSQLDFEQLLAFFRPFGRELIAVVEKGLAA